MEPLKYVYNKSFFEHFTTAIHQEIPDFDQASFLNSIFDEKWKLLELKQRMRHITLSLRPHLPKDYKKMIQVVLGIIQQLRNNKISEQGFEWMFLPEFVELYGMDDLKTSIIGLEKITQFTSCEFAVRPFIVKYPKKMMEQMLVWTNHKHPMVRRLATEGSRPRLPWAMALPLFKKDPSSVLPILGKLKNDTSESVRRSVANNLNDIAKDNPQIVIDIAKKWLGETQEIDKLIKHACRTLLKQGNPEVMPLFGFGSVEKIQVDEFNILTPTVEIGAYFSFSFVLKNNGPTALLRLEYGLYYQKANGTLARKVFKISEKEYEKESITTIDRRQSFKVISTRKFHKGLHQVAIIINGQEFEHYDFQLL